MKSKQWMLAALVLALVLAAWPALGESGDTVVLYIDGAFETDLARSMLDQVNELRTGGEAWYWDETDTEKLPVTGLQALKYDYCLEQVAMQRAAELAFYYSHTRPNGERCFTAYPSRMKGAVAENIAYGYTSTQAAFIAWAEENKPYDGQGHRRNMLSSEYVSIGIGCFRHNGVLYWAQEFSNRVSGDPEGALETPAAVEALTSGVATALEDLDHKISLEIGAEQPLSEYATLPATSLNGKSIAFAIKDMTWTTDDSDVAEIAGDSLLGKARGTTALTGRAGTLSVSFPVKVLHMDESFKAKAAVNAEQGSAYIMVLDVQLPSEPGAASYSVVVSIPETSTHSAYTDDDLSRLNHAYYFWHGLVAYPLHVTVEASALDDEGFVIAQDVKHAVAYPQEGTLYLPSGLKEIGEEALEGNSACAIVVPDGCESIGARAFADSSGLYSVRIPASVTSIAPDALSGCGPVIIEAPKGSEGMRLALEKGYPWFEVDG